MRINPDNLPEAIPGVRDFCHRAGHAQTEKAGRVTRTTLNPGNQAKKKRESRLPRLFFFTHHS